MPKTYVLDTNVLLHNPGALFAFEDNEVVIPMAVIEEIDNQKKRQDEIGRNARVVSQETRRMRESGACRRACRFPRAGSCASSSTTRTPWAISLPAWTRTRRTTGSSPWPTA